MTSIQNIQKHWGILAIIALVLASCWVIQTKPFKLGLDLSGGVKFLLQAKPTPTVPKITPQVMETLHNVMEKRVNPTGTEENVVQKVGDSRIQVEIPDTSDLDSARSVIGKMGQLEFKAADRSTGTFISTGLGGNDLTSATLEKDFQGKGWKINLTFNLDGQKKFTEITRLLAPSHGQLGIFFDGALQSAPAVNEVISSGSAQITGNFEKEEAQAVVDILNAGALPVDIEIIEESTIGPLLGKASMDKSLIGGLIGLALVVGFMLFYYRVPGIYATIALGVYTLLLLAVTKLSPASLSLSGIAGIILSIGMAVDANILIFERTKEELISGRTVDKAVELGFDRAFDSILDSNLTTILSCGVLYYFGSGLVKGFAFNLALGVAISFFTAIVVTRTLMRTMPINGPIAMFFGINPKLLQATHTTVETTTESKTTVSV